ncbi:MAG TPA: nucleotidyltransferase family protein [Streptosporangiaceae bacterium]|nr:nucleotidyltransferase family protein [Streptosporangiaceae bacterium]
MSTPPGVAGVLLAAGEGARFGKPKALAEFAGEPLADRGVRLLRDGGAMPVIVVTGAATVELGWDLADVIVAHNPGWRAGMGSSLAVGLTAAPAAARAAVVALVDQPLVGPQAVRRLVTAYLGGAAVAVAAYHGQMRNPVLIAREHWAEVIERAAGDVGARPFLRAHPELVTVVECGDTGDPADADTPEDLAMLARRVSAARTAAPRRGTHPGQVPGRSGPAR